MGYVDIIEMNEDGVTVTPLSQVSDEVRLQLWLDIFRLESENK